MYNHKLAVINAMQLLIRIVQELMTENHGANIAC